MFPNCLLKLRFINRTQHLVNAVRLRHKLKISEKSPPKVSADVVKYLETLPYYNDIKENIPKSLLRKYKTPENMYLINQNTAKEVVYTLKKHLETNSPVVEVNPGFGFLSEELLKLKLIDLHIFETSNYFSYFIDKLHIKYPGRVNYKIADFFGMWKMAFEDKLDNGSRIKELLGDLATDDNNRILKIVGAMPGLNFVRHLITSIIFHSTSNQLGRPDLFIVMSGHDYNYLTDIQIQNGKHKHLPALFQLLFDYKIITKVPKAYYLPWTMDHPPESKKSSVVDDLCLYLVNITQKKKLPCSGDHLPLLWYFLKPHMICKTTRVIPTLEQWISGCGVWLITGQDPPETNKLLAPTEDDAKLPHMNIFTEFGDLSLLQKLTVFKRSIGSTDENKENIENNLLIMPSPRTMISYSRTFSGEEARRRYVQCIAPSYFHTGKYPALRDHCMGKSSILDTLASYPWEKDFDRFISWPEFEQCAFRITMENNLPKFVTALDVDKDAGATLGTHVLVDDDASDHSDAEN